MGPEKPPKLNRGPKWLQKSVNDIRDYVVGSHIEKVTVRAPSNGENSHGEVTSIPFSGTILSIVAGSNLSLPSPPSSDGLYVLAVQVTTGTNNIHWHSTSNCTN